MLVCVTSVLLHCIVISLEDSLMIELQLVLKIGEHRVVRIEAMGVFIIYI